MSLETVKKYFSHAGIDQKIQVFSVLVSRGTSLPKLWLVFQNTSQKNLSFKLKKVDHYLLVVTAGDAKIDNKKYKSAFGKRALMLKTDEVETIIGYPLGGCLFGIHSGTTVYLDGSLKRFIRVYPTCGSPDSVLERTIPELEKYTQFKKGIAVCKIGKINTHE